MLGLMFEYQLPTHMWQLQLNIELGARGIGVLQFFSGNLDVSQHF